MHVLPASHIFRQACLKIPTGALFFIFLKIRERDYTMIILAPSIFKLIAKQHYKKCKVNSFDE